MQNRREAVFKFKTGSLTITGHRELDGTYQKLKSAELAPIELLLAGENGSAYTGFRKLGLDDQAILQLVERCLVNLPSRRKVLYDFVKHLIDQGLKDRRVIHLAALAAVAVEDRAAAKAWYTQILKEKPDDADALSSMRMMGQIATSGGWKLPFPLADAYLPPTAAELARVRSEWKSRDLKPREIRKEHETHLKINGAPVPATAISYLIHGQRNFGVVLVPLGAKDHSYPVLVELKGVSPSYFPLKVPGGILAPSILGPDLHKFVLFLPAVRGEQLLFDGKTYQCEGDPDDSWDGATDDRRGVPERSRVMQLKFNGQDHIRRHGTVAQKKPAYRQDQAQPVSRLYVSCRDLRRLSNMHNLAPPRVSDDLLQFFEFTTFVFPDSESRFFTIIIDLYRVRLYTL
jgi:hypothetical protein